MHQGMFEKFKPAARLALVKGTGERGDMNASADQLGGDLVECVQYRRIPVYDGGAVRDLRGSGDQF